MGLEGTYLGRYHIVRLLGSGGMGEVYLAEDPRIRQQVALKVIRTEMQAYPGLPTGDEAARLFLREAQAIVALDHPAILPLHDYGEVQVGETRLTFLVMPYRKEGSLAAWVRRQAPDGRLPPSVVAHLVSQAAEALQHSHDHGVIHQDIKPANFLLRERFPGSAVPDVLLADFGIARLTASTANTSQAIRGTPTYMAPEQCLGQPVIASDQYALAIMAYELLAGHPPFVGSPMQIMFQHVNAQPEAPSVHCPTLSSSIDEVLLIALAKRPEDRFRSVRALAVAFQEAVQTPEAEDAETITTPGPTPKLTAPLPDPPLISSSLAQAPTYISSPPISPPEDAPVSESPAEDIPTPAPSTWAAGSTGPTAAPLPETIDLSQRPVHEAAPGWTAAVETPTAPPLEDTRSLASWGTSNAPGAAEANPAAPVAPQPMSRQQRRPIGRFLLIGAAALVILALVGGGLAYLLAGASASVTITLKSQTLNDTSTIQGVTGTPDSAQQQVGARMLSATTPAQTQTVTATGQKNVAATQGRGTLILANNTTTSVTFTAGMTFSNNAGNGCTHPQIDIVLDATVTVPPGGPTVGDPAGYAYAPGHVLQAGAIGNVNYVSDACGLLFMWDGNDGSCVPVSSALPCWQVWPKDFSGGQDAYSGPVVQQSDINAAIQALEAANQSQPQQVLQSQLRPNEQLLDTASCAPATTADHAAGDAAAQVTVSLTYTCTGEAFDADGATDMAVARLTQQAAADPGAGYALVGSVKSSIIDATADAQNTVTIHVSASGIWAYHINAAQQQALARLIAGKTTQEAQRLLLAQTGIAQASIKLSGIWQQRLPSDPAKISILVQAP